MLPCIVLTRTLTCAPFLWGYSCCRSTWKATRGATFWWDKRLTPYQMFWLTTVLRLMLFPRVNAWQTLLWGRILGVSKMKLFQWGRSRYWRGGGNSARAPAKMQSFSLECTRVVVFAWPALIWKWSRSSDYHCHKQMPTRCIFSSCCPPSVPLLI